VLTDVYLRRGATGAAAELAAIVSDGFAAHARRLEARLDQRRFLTTTEAVTPG
jgi:hypothetical protein